MTLFRRRRLLRARHLAAVAAAWLAGCSSPAVSTKAASSSGAPGRTAAESVEPPINSTPSDAAVNYTKPVDPVELVAKREMWPLDPGSAEELLRGLGHVRRETPEPRALSLIGGPSGALARFEVSYSQDDAGQWAFNVANFFFGEADLPALNQKIETAIIERLGKPDWTERQAELPSSGWSLGRDMNLLLAPSPNQGERLVLLSVSEPEGEAE
jgi:hypothetical protein